MAASSPSALTLAPTSDPRVFLAPGGARMTPPADWACLPPGDAGLTRRVKAAGPSWVVVEKKGRKTFSKGLWAPRATIEAAKAALGAEREDPKYAKKLASAQARREKEQAAYVATFEDEVRVFLGFSPAFAELERTIAHAVTAHATPVGSGTVARTKRISVDRRAEAAVIAWMRHQTTTYDDMRIPREKGARREVRQELARISRRLLDRHRNGAGAHAAAACPLCARRAPQVEPDDDHEDDEERD